MLENCEEKLGVDQVLARRLIERLTRVTKNLLFYDHFSLRAVM